MRKNRNTDSQHLRWIAIFCLVTFCFIALGIIYYRYEAQRIEDDKYEDISVIAKLKADSIQDWRRQRLADVHRVAIGPLVRKEIARLLHDPMNTSARAALQIQLNVNKKGTVYADALFLDTKGSVLLSYNPNPFPVDQATMKAIRIALKDRKEELSDFFRDPKDVIYIDVVAPISDNNGQPIAIVVLRSKAEDFLYPLIRTWPTPSKTAETLLVRRDGDSVLFLNELRHKSNTALNLRIPLANGTLPAVQTVSGKYNRLYGKDFRGVDVLAVGRPILQSPWFIVTEIDEKEILTEVRYRAWVIFIIIVLLVMITAGIISFIYRNQREAERNRADKALCETEERFAAAFHASPDLIAITRMADGKIVDVNDGYSKLLGYSHDESIGRTTAELSIWANSADRATFVDILEEFGEINNFETTLQRKDGRLITVVDSARTIELQGEKCLLSVAHDITERKRAEAEIARTNRALLMLSSFNQTLIHIVDETTLLNEICRIVVDVGGYRMAWVGFAEHDEAKTVRPVAYAGFESGYIESAKVTWADSERGRGPGGTAIRTGQPCIARNIPLDAAFAPWRDAAIERGYKSNIALPLISGGQTFGELTIYSVEADAFDAREVEILKEMADDLAFGINALRTRVQRDQTEVALRDSEERYRIIAENTADTIAVFDLNFNPTYISPSILKLRGLTVEEAMTQTLNQILTPDSLQQASKMFADQMALESSGTADPARTALIELEEYCKDGSTIWVELAASFLRDNNFKPTRVLTITRDITERKQAEEALKNSELKYRNIFENAIEGIYQSTTEGRFITANVAFAHMAGYDSPEEFIESIKDIGTQLYVHPEDRTRFLKIRDEKGFVSGFEVEFYKKDGSTFWVVINARTVRDEQGKILYMEGLIEDITIRKKAEEQLHRTLDSLKKAVGTTIQVLGTASEARDPYTAGHQKRVADLAVAIAKEMGLPDDKIEGLRMAGSIHDIGKISIPAEILSKPTKLTNTEYSIIKEHSRTGYDMLKDVESSWPLAQIVYQHHERMDGSGYPRNLKGDEILLEARILAVADVVEAMGSHRPYRPTLGMEAALAEIEKHKRILYDNTVADACLKLFRKKGYQLP